MPDYTKEQLRRTTLRIENRGLKPAMYTKIFDGQTGEEITNISRVTLDIQTEPSRLIADVTFWEDTQDGLETVTTEHVECDIDALVGKIQRQR